MSTSQPLPQRLAKLQAHVYKSGDGYGYGADERARTAKLDAALCECVSALEKYQDYCVPMWVDSGMPEFQVAKEVWLAKEKLTALLLACAELEGA